MTRVRWEFPGGQCAAYRPDGALCGAPAAWYDDGPGVVLCEPHARAAGLPGARIVGYLGQEPAPPADQEIGTATEGLDRTLYDPEAALAARDRERAEAVVDAWARATFTPVDGRLPVVPRRPLLVELIVAVLAERPGPPPPPAAPAPAPSPAELMLEVQKRGRTFLRRIEDVALVELRHGLVHVVCIDGADFTSDAPLARLHRRLQRHGFLAINRQALVNLAHVTELERAAGGRLRIVLDVAGVTEPVAIESSRPGAARWRRAFRP